MPMDITQTIVTALRAFADGENPDQPTTKIMYERGYITIAEVPHMGSSEREYLAISITTTGRELMECVTKS
jgi:hypothetical protein